MYDHDTKSKSHKIAIQLQKLNFTLRIWQKSKNVKFYVGITDPRWFDFLRGFSLEDVNFWRPGDVTFKAVPQGGPFVFKLKGQINKIVGLGFFYQYIRLPILVAWDTFGIGNGFSFFNDFAIAINEPRRNTKSNQELGRIVLTKPICLETNYFFRK